MLHSLIRRKRLKYDYFSVSFCRPHLIFVSFFLQTTFDYYLQSPIRGYNHTTLRIPKLGLLQYFYFLQIKLRDVCHMIFAVKDSIIYLSARISWIELPKERLPVLLYRKTKPQKCGSCWEMMKAFLFLWKHMFGWEPLYGGEEHIFNVSYEDGVA